MRILTECNLAQLVVDVLNGQTVVFPTETSYGLGCDATNQEAVDKIFKIKERRSNKPLLVVVPNIAMAKRYLVWNELLDKIANRYWPGAVTIVGECYSDPSQPPVDLSRPPLKRGGGDVAPPLFKEGAHGGGQFDKLSHGGGQFAIPTQECNKDIRMLAFNRTKDLRRSLRKNKTEAEKILWSCLKAKQIGGCKFRRQHGIGKYIVDFYQSNSKLVIEVDGDIHFEKTEQEFKDVERQKWFESMGYKVLRFNNVDVFGNLENVLDDIYRAVIEHLTHPNLPLTHPNLPLTPPGLPLKGEVAMSPPLFLRRGLTGEVNSTSYRTGEVNLRLARGVVSQNNTLAVRVTAHPLLQSITEKLGRPLVATSANLADTGDIYQSSAIITQFAEREHQPDILLDYGELPKRPPTTIVSVVNNKLVVLRQGEVVIGC